MVVQPRAQRIPIEIVRDSVAWWWEAVPVVTSPLSLTGFPLELLVLVPFAIAVVTASRTRELEPPRALAVAAITPLLVVAASVIGAGEALYRPLLTIARAGSLDLGLSLVLDPAAAFAAGAIAVSVLVLAVRALASGRAPRAFARIHAIEAGAMLAILADNLVLAFAGWLVIAALSARATASFAWARTGDAAFIVATALAFWMLAGSHGPRGFLPDLRPRFAPSNADIRDDPTAWRDGADARLAQRIDEPPGPDVIAPREIPRRPPPPRPDVPRGVPTAETGSGQLTMTTHPGARIYLGVATVDELRANLDRPRCEDEIRIDCFATAPFVRVPIRAGIHRLAVVPGGGAVVEGEGVEAAGFTLRVARGEEVQVEAIGPTLRFAELDRELRRRDRSALRAIGGMAPPWWVGLLFTVALAAMAGMAPFFWLADAAARLAGKGGLGPLPIVVAPLVATYFGVRLGAAIAPAGATLAWLGAGSALVAGVIATRQRDPRRALAYIAAAATSSLLAGGEAGWALVVGAAVNAVCLTAWWTALEAACGELPDDIDTISAVATRPQRAALVAAAGLVGLPPLAGYLAREGALATAKDAAGMAAWVVAVGASFALAFAVTRVQRTVFAAKPHPKRDRNPHTARVATAALAAAGLVIVLGTVVALSDRPIGGSGQALAFSWIGGLPGSRGGGRIVLSAVLAAMTLAGIALARRDAGGGGAAARVIAAELGWPRVVDRLATIGGVAARAGHAIDAVVAAPFMVAGRHLGAALGRLGATGGGRAAIVAVTVVVVALAVGVVAR